MFSVIARRGVLAPTALRAACRTTPVATLKATTNLVGLDVVPNAPEVLSGLYATVRIFPSTDQSDNATSFANVIR